MLSLRRKLQKIDQSDEKMATTLLKNQKTIKIWAEFDWQSTKIFTEPEIR